MKENAENSIFESHSKDINILEILREIESKLPKREIDLRDIQRISELSKEKLESKSLRFFDPAYTAHLFEKGIAPLKFSNPKLWFIKGPFKWFLNKLVEIYSLFDKKISENKIKAFYELVHEVMLVNQRHKALEEKFYELLNDYINLKNQLTQNQNSKLNEIRNFFINNLYEKIEEYFWSLIQESKSVALLFPQTFHLIRRLESSNIPFLAITDQVSIYEFIKSNYSGRIQFLEEPLEWKELNSFDSFVICKNLSEFSPWSVQQIFLSLQKKIISSSKLYVWFKNSSVSSTNPFQENFPTKIDLNLLSDYLNQIEFRLLGYEMIENEIFILNIQKK